MYIINQGGLLPSSKHFLNKSGFFLDSVFRLVLAIAFGAVQGDQIGEFSPFGQFFGIFSKTA
jgi:hypothetical protein